MPMTSEVIREGALPEVTLRRGLVLMDVGVRARSIQKDQMEQVRKLSLGQVRSLMYLSMRLAQNK